MKFDRFCCNVNTRFHRRFVLLIALMTLGIVGSITLRADTGNCGGASITLPFTDVPSNSIFFCSIAEAYFSALTNGTSSTTYSPAANVTREQMSAFVTRTLDQSLQRGSRRAVLHQFWTTQGANNLALTGGMNDPLLVKCDGVDLWVANFGNDTVSRVRASDGRLLETWTGATGAIGVLTAMGKVFITGNAGTGKLYQIDPTQAPGAVSILSSSVGSDPHAIAYDGLKIWTANSGGSVSIINVNPISVSSVVMGFSTPVGMLYDGSNIWVTDPGDNKLKQLDANGAILQSVTLGSSPYYPAFDGTNIWVPNIGSNTVSVVRASTAVVIATLSGNGLNGPYQAAFDGERILVTNNTGSSVSLWRATDLTPIGTFSVGSSVGPYGVCSDGLNFWISLANTNQLARF